MPGMTVYRERSITSAPAGGAPAPTAAIRSSVTMMTALAITLPLGSIALPARIALVAAKAGATQATRIATVAQVRATVVQARAAVAQARATVVQARATVAQPFRAAMTQGWPAARLRSWLFILCSCFFDLTGDFPRQSLRRDDTRKRTEAQNPTVECPVEADIEGHQHAAARLVAQPLRLVPFAGVNIVGHGRLKLDLHALGRSRVDAERMRERFVRQLLDRPEACLAQGELAYPVDRKRAHLAVFGNEGEQI